jgi:hypothetical protein
MTYLFYLCLLAHSGVQQILCCVFVLFSSSMLPVSLDCPFFDCPLGIFYRLFAIKENSNQTVKIV